MFPSRTTFRCLRQFGFEMRKDVERDLVDSLGEGASGIDYEDFVDSVKKDIKLVRPLLPLLHLIIVLLHFHNFFLYLFCLLYHRFHVMGIFLQCNALHSTAQSRSPALSYIV